MLDLGLIRTEGHIRIANRIYQEVIPRELIYSTQLTITHETAWYVRREDGLIEMNLLLSAFQDFFRQYSKSWEEGFHYRETGSQMLMQAFLQRVVNGGGRMEREYGFGRKRTDLLVVWPHKTGVQKVVIELKVRRNEALETIIKEGVGQTWEYMDKCGTDQGHLVIFDKNKKKTWDKKIFKRKRVCNGLKIMIWGM